MKLSTTSKSEALGNCNFPQIYSLGWFEATSTPTSLNTLSTFMIHEICRPQKKGMEKQKRIPESMIGGSNKFILVYLILSHNYTHDSSLLHQHLYMSFFARQPSAMPRYLSHWLRSLGVFESWRLLQFGCTIPVLTHTIETRSPQFVHIWWLLYNYIYTSIIYSSLCIYIYIYMHNSYIIMMERPLTCKLVTVSIAQTGCAAAQSHRLTLAAPQFAPLRPSQGPRLPLVVSTCFNHRFSQPPAIEWLNTIIP